MTARRFDLLDWSFDSHDLPRVTDIDVSYEVPGHDWLPLAELSSAADPQPVEPSDAYMSDRCVPD